MKTDEEIREELENNVVKFDPAKKDIASRWRDLLLLSHSGTIKKHIHNAELPLRRDPAFVGKIRFDDFRQRMVCCNMPWQPGGGWREWQDSDDRRLASWLQKQEIDVTVNTAADAAANVADDRRFHDVRDFFSSLGKWDEQKRIDHFFERYFGADVDPNEGFTHDQVLQQMEYVGQVGRKFLLSAIARVMQPGCKVDTCPILEGPQGAGKSSGLRALVPNPEWFADQIAALGTKDSCHDLAGKWLIEIAELSAIRGDKIEHTKAFMSRGVDHYRQSYGRRSMDFPRQCVFAGTTNADDYLKDETGNRRFLPIRVGKIDVTAIVRDRDQIWAEAFAAYQAGETWWLDKDVEAIASNVQAARKPRDPWYDDVMERATLINGSDKPVTTEAILTQILPDAHQRTRAAATRVGAILNDAQWKKTRQSFDGRRPWVYSPPENTQ